MTETNPKILLSDYAEPTYTIQTCTLTVAIFDDRTQVQAVLDVSNNKLRPGEDLSLHRSDYVVSSVELDGKDITGSLDVSNPSKLVIPGSHLTGDRHQLTIANVIHPDKNTSLEGLYMSDGIYCTQCEAEGFRRITPFLDRPDNMACFEVRIEAGKHLPHLLSNGNLMDAGDLDDNRHYAVWKDPFPKPCYLFALVAGDMETMEGQFTTRSGKDIPLEFFTNKGKADQCAFALQALKDAMKWDEETFSLEYDLDRYMVVAVDSFNAGAMENKGLNIFNSALTLANPDIATDADHARIQGVIGHEYFHNWTGNRVTCRDWFQLTLKEGLTVFRDQEFSSDLNTRSLKRLEDASLMVAKQFAEDRGSMAHPIRPEAYEEINNFYTLTVYEKGAEVIRMIQTLLGEADFKRGISKYFELYDGQAVCTEDFVHAMEVTSGRDLTQFKKWYSQIGTPELKLLESYDADKRTFELRVQQSNAHPKKTTEKLHIPLKAKLFAPDGETLVKDRILECKDTESVFKFEGVTKKPLVSINREFTAPVLIHREMGAEDHMRLCQLEDDVVSKVLMMKELVSRDVESGTFSNGWMDYQSGVMNQDAFSGSEKRALMTLPSLSSISDHLESSDFVNLAKNRETFFAKWGELLEDTWLNTLKSHDFQTPYAFNPEEVSRRDQFILALSMLSPKSAHHGKIADAFDQAQNMTEEEASLFILCRSGAEGADARLATFLEKWKDHSTVVLKWLRAHALFPKARVFDKLQDALDSGVYSRKVPNHIYRLVLGFADGNTECFHQPEGKGYDWVANEIIAVDDVNAYVSARVGRIFQGYKRLSPELKAPMKKALERIQAKPNLSKNLSEVIHNTLS